ncbi:hypothetical protein J6TS1_49230 [Siminovitchia terrae]|uniref:Uncharacterized protein n=1 Tax=Siminovitchia terrae TaxID=1914933 RepID=A0ABQ4L470_SIMTE|nr:hypothetical protein [Siminovitchia terrae]GIN99053.1 hypothetical protein J6TS1_49230 [Siminovitchia terrae]
MTFTWLKKEYLITIIDAERILLNLFEARVLETKMNKPGLRRMTEAVLSNGWVTLGIFMGKK